MSQIANANPYRQAVAFFNSGEAADLQSLLTDHTTVNRSGRCTQVYNSHRVEKRAYLVLPVDGEFGRSVFIGFEHFDEQNTDQTIIADARFSFRHYWGALYQEEGILLQAAYSNASANHYIEYRISTNAEEERFLIRKYYADKGVYGPNRRWYIAAFDPIELCWAKID